MDRALLIADNLDGPEGQKFQHLSGRGFLSITGGCAAADQQCVQVACLVSRAAAPQDKPCDQGSREFPVGSDLINSMQPQVGAAAGHVSLVHAAASDRPP